MKKFIQNIIAALVLLSSSLAVPTLAVSTASADTKTAVCQGINSTGVGGTTCNPKPFTTLLKSVINILLFIIGSIAVIMIIIGGIRYVTSNGDSAQTKSAKDTVLYSVVGLVIAVMAYAIVNFIVASL